jgi:hypothetical protein
MAASKKRGFAEPPVRRPESLKNRKSLSPLAVFPFI